PRRLSMCASTMPPPPKLHVMTALGANRSAAQSKICSAVHLSACLEIVFNSFIFIDSSPRPSLCYERAAARVRVAGPGPDRSDELCRKVRRRPRQRAKGRRRGRCGDEGPCRRGPRDPGTPAGAAAAGGARGLRRPKGAFDGTSRFRRRGRHRAPRRRPPAGGDPGIPGRRRGPPRPAGPGGCGVRKEPSMKRVGSGEEAGTGRPASASRRANTAAPWAAAVVIVVALAAAWFALERGVFTQPWRQAAARELSQALGAPVSVEAVGAGVNRLVLHEV